MSISTFCVKFFNINTRQRDYFLIQSYIHFYKLIMYDKYSST